MFFYSLLSYLFLISLNLLVCSNDKGIILESPILSKIDGLKGLMDEHKIHKCLYTAKEISKIQYGLIDKKTKNRYPQYEFNKKFYTLKDLVKIERKYISSGNQEKLKELNSILEKVKKDFLSFSNKLMDDAKGTQEYMFELIKESCIKRKRFDSCLLNWAKNSHLTQEQSLNKDVKSLNDMDIFCTDLNNFLKDLVRSCPKAFERFKEWRKNQKK